ncbi:hypothetical protein [Hydrocarboniphaga effusa]|uniref:hypothetical protein n=1 Tax=Hydrocarboniphaga effusa TaxID=243629 RepID=UPI00398BE2C1
MSNKGSPSYIAAHGTRKRSKPIDIKIADQLCDGPDNVPGIAIAIEHKQGEVIEGLLRLIEIGWVERVEGDVMTSYQLAVVKSANPLRRAA